MNDDPQTGATAARGSTGDADGKTAPASRPPPDAEPHGADRPPRAEQTDGLAEAFH